MPIKVLLKRAFGALSMIIGSALIVWFLYNLVSPTSSFQSGYLGAFGLLLPVCMVWFGWRWLADGGPGIEAQDIDVHAPEIVGSVSMARKTLPRFLEEARNHMDGAYIKFPLTTDRGVTEHIWAYVHHYGNGVFNVSLANTPYTQKGELPPRRDVPEHEVEDWQIMRKDGRIRGAYSLIGAFCYLERKGVRLNRAMRKQRAQLIDAAELPTEVDGSSPPR